MLHGSLIQLYDYLDKAHQVVGDSLGDYIFTCSPCLSVLRPVFAVIFIIHIADQNTIKGKGKVDEITLKTIKIIKDQLI